MGGAGLAGRGRCTLSRTCSAARFASRHSPAGRRHARAQARGAAPIRWRITPSGSDRTAAARCRRSGVSATRGRTGRARAWTPSFRRLASTPGPFRRWRASGPTPPSKCCSPSASKSRSTRTYSSHPDARVRRRSLAVGRSAAVLPRAVPPVPPAGPEQGLSFVLRLVNFATRRFAERRGTDCRRRQREPRVVRRPRVFRWHYDWPHSTAPRPMFAHGAGAMAL